VKKFIYLILILYLIGISKTVAQSDSSRYKFIGGSTQVYPAGIIAAVQTEIFYNTYTSLFFLKQVEILPIEKILARTTTMKKEMALGHLPHIANTLI